MATADAHEWRRVKRSVEVRRRVMPVAAARAWRADVAAVLQLVVRVLLPLLAQVFAFACRQRMVVAVGFAYALALCRVHALEFARALLNVGALRGRHLLPAVMIRWWRWLGVLGRRLWCLARLRRSNSAWHGQQAGTHGDGEEAFHGHFPLRWATAGCCASQR